MDTVEYLGDAARGARECAVMGQAVTLARWIGNGRRPVTAGRVLRKADVPAAGAALGVDVPPRLRTMADIRALHRPWRAAIATGLLQVGDGSVTAGAALECWPPDDADLLAVARGRGRRGGPGGHGPGRGAQPRVGVHAGGGPG